MRGDRGPEGGSDRPEDTTPEDVKPRENPGERPENIDLDPETQKLRDEIQELLDNQSEILEEVPEKDPEGIELSPVIKLLRDEIQDLLNQENPEVLPIQVPEKKPLSDRIADELRKTRESMMNKFNKVATALLNESHPSQPNSNRNVKPRPREMKPQLVTHPKIQVSRHKKKLEKTNISRTMKEKIDDKPKMSKEEIKEKLEKLEKLLFPDGLNNEKQKDYKKILEKEEKKSKKLETIDEKNKRNFEKNMEKKMNKKELLLKEMKDLAHKLGGECLSKEYINSKKNLNWKCKEGHLFKKTPKELKREIKQGKNWCSICGKEERKQNKLKEIAKKVDNLGYDLLSTNYVDKNSKLIYNCRKHNQKFEKSIKNINRGLGCPKCSKENKILNEIKRKNREFLKIKDKVEKLGGKCNSKEYVDDSTKLNFTCKNDHNFDMSPQNIKRGYWCRDCSDDKKRGTIEEIKQIAEKRGYKCISNEYINAKSKLTFICQKNHRFEMTSDKFKQGQGCKECHFERLKDSFDEIKKIASKKGYVCLSNLYINSYTKLDWICEKNHNFSMTSTDIKRGHGCSECHIDEIRDTLENIIEIAEKRGYKVNSTEYINNYTEMNFTCPKNHNFDMTSGDFKSGRSCPDCGYYATEIECRKAIEFIFNGKFPKSRPIWLVNEDGNRLELDGYNKKLKLAFEYDGRQHFQYIEFFHSNKQDFERQQKNDGIKDKLCEEKGIHLIRIPYTINPKDFQDYIIDKCRELNYDI